MDERARRFTREERDMVLRGSTTEDRPASRLAGNAHGLVFSNFQRRHPDIYQRWPNGSAALYRLTEAGGELQRELLALMEAGKNAAPPPPPPPAIAPASSIGVRASVGVAVRREGGTLLLRRGPDAVNGAGEWTLPGGKIDPGETIAAAAARELHEEVGLRAKPVRTGIISEDMHWGPDLAFITLYHIAREWSGTPSLVEPHKHDAIRWVDDRRLREAALHGDPDLPLFPPTRDFVLAGGLDL